jgi:hypothetical protein
MTARNSDRHREVPLGDRAAPNFVTSPALPDEPASRGTRQVAQFAIELRRHSNGNRFGFASAAPVLAQLLLPRQRPRTWL